MSSDTIIGIDPGSQGGIAVMKLGEVTTYKLSKLTDQDVFRTLAEMEPAQFMPCLALRLHRVA